MTEPTEANPYPSPAQDAADEAEAEAVEEMLAEEERGYWAEAKAKAQHYYPTAIRGIYERGDD